MHVELSALKEAAKTYPTHWFSQLWVISSSFKDFLLIFGANGSWISVPEIPKVFYPLSLVFYPLFAFENTCCYFHISAFATFSWGKRGGKKLVRGVKNFWVAKYGHSASICTKNQQKIFKTRKISPKWNFFIFDSCIQVYTLVLTLKIGQNKRIWGWHRSKCWIHE